MFVRLVTNLFPLLALVALVSCVKEMPDSPSPAQEKTIMISALTESNPDVKTTLDGNDESGYDVVWCEGDKIVFLNLDLTKGEDVKEFTLVEGAGTTSGKFSGPELVGGDYVVDYDNISFAWLLGIGQVIPQTQIYYPGQARPTGLMRAYVTVEDGKVPDIQFKNTTALIRLELKGTGTIKEFTIYSKDGNECICGRGDVDKETFVFSTHYSSELTVTAPNGIPLTPEGTPVYVIVPQNTYSQFCLRFWDFDGNRCERNLKEGRTVETVRSKITKMVVPVEGMNTRLTWDSPAGARAMMDGREAMVVDLGGNIGKLAVATTNIDAKSETAKPDNYGKFFTWFEAIGAQNTGTWGEGWRMPVKDEFQALCTAEEPYPVVNNNLEYKVSDGATLYFPLSGYYDWTGYNGEGIYAYFWGMDFREYDDNLEIFTDQYSLTGFLNEFGAPLDEKSTVRPVHKLPITRNTPVGMVGYLGGKDAMVVELNIGGKTKKLAVAVKNEDATSVSCYLSQNGKTYLDCFGSYLSHDDARGRIDGGWRLPSQEEMAALVNLPHQWVRRGVTSTDSFGDNAAFVINVTSDAKLFLPAAGSPDVGSSKGGLACYWTSTAGDDKTKFGSLNFHGNNPMFATVGKERLLSVRLVQDIPDYM